MSSPVPPNDIPRAISGDDPSLRSLEAAAQALELAVQAGCRDSGALMMLALAHKRRGHWTQARQALNRIASPDVNVFLQQGLLALRENSLVQAEIEFTQARELDPRSFAAAFNLLLVQLRLGKLDACLLIWPAIAALAADRDPTERRLLSALHALLTVNQRTDAAQFLSVLTGLDDADEQRLLRLLAALGRLDTELSLLRTLTNSRPDSFNSRTAYCEAVLLKGKQLVDCCSWQEAERFLRPLAVSDGANRQYRAAWHNLLGVCACMVQDFSLAEREFSAALKLVGHDARLQQNLALTRELAGEFSKADSHWNRFFDLLEAQPGSSPELAIPPADAARRPGYLRRLAFEGLTRLASIYSDKEKWGPALVYSQRAVRLRPNNFEALERLFHLSLHCRQSQEARRALDQMRRLRPAEPQLELYELDFHEIKTLADMELQLTEIQRIRDRHPGDTRVDERATKMVGDVMPRMDEVSDQLAEQLSRVVDQVRHLPNHEINWAAVREVMRDLLKEFQVLQRLVGKCSPLVAADEQRRRIRDLAERIDKKMEACRSLGA